MQTILFYFCNFLFTAIFAMYTKYQFQDEKSGWALSKGKWHKYGLAMRVAFVAAFFIGYYVVPFLSWKDWLLCGAIDMPLWDMLINKVALEMPVFYNGTTSTLDKKFKGIKWIAYGALLIGAVIIRFTY